MSHEKNTGWLGYLWGIILPRYIGIIVSHYKDPYKPSRIQWKVIRFVFCRGSSDLNLQGILFRWVWHHQDCVTWHSFTQPSEQCQHTGSWHASTVEIRRFRLGWLWILPIKNEGNGTIHQILNKRWWSRIFFRPYWFPQRCRSMYQGHISLPICH